VDGSSKPSRSRRGGHQKAPSVLPSASEAVAIPSHRGRGSGRSSTGDPFLSRSVPVGTSVGALPDWDMPPSFGSTTDRKTEIHPSPIQSRRERPAPVPWLEAFEDDTVPSTVDQKAQSSPNVHFPIEPPSPTRRNARPMHHHTRTSSVPSISVNPLMQKESPGPLDRSKDGNVVKYAGGRFQSAPAPTFLPMPSFQT
jgi:Proline-rich nuclear receptor coactivator motif